MFESWEARNPRVLVSISVAWMVTGVGSSNDSSIDPDTGNLISDLRSMGFTAEQWLRLLQPSFDRI